MADTVTGILSSADQMKANYEKYKDKFKDSTDELVNSETFLNLMVAEMTNQDPLEPTSNTEFVAQLAQFTQLTYAQDSSKFAMANYAATLVGKIATGSKMEGKDLVTRTGVVESVTQVNNSYMVRIDGVDFDIKKITAVKDKGSSDTTSVSSNALADSIAKAAGMVGMYATVDIGKDDKTGVTATKSGFIDSIKVKDGKITAVIADPDGQWTIEQPLEKITEVTYATIVEEPEDGDKVDAGKLPSKAEETDEEKVDGVDGDKKNAGSADTDKVNESTKTDESNSSSGVTIPEITDDDIDVKYNFIVENDDPSNTSFN